MKNALTLKKKAETGELIKFISSPECSARYLALIELKILRVSRRNATFSCQSHAAIHQMSDSSYS